MSFKLPLLALFFTMPTIGLADDYWDTYQSNRRAEAARIETQNAMEAVQTQINAIESERRSEAFRQNIYKQVNEPVNYGENLYKKYGQ